MAEATPARRNRGETIRTGIAGEFFVAGDPSKRDWIATLTAKNTPDIDVLASRPTGDMHAPIQVKTRSPAYPLRSSCRRELKSVGDRDFLVLWTSGASQRRRGTG